MENMERRSAENNLLGANINQWAEKLYSADEDLARGLDEPRSVGDKGLETLDLPRKPLLVIGLEDFLCLPEEFVQATGSDRVVVNLYPKEDGLSRFAMPGLTAQEAEKFIRDNLADEKLFSKYDISLMPYWPVKYGGNIVVNPSGKILMEFRAGNPGPVASGRETPPFSTWRDQFTGSFGYSFPDVGLRQTAHDILMAIPHEGSGRDRDAQFTPGYYEFVLNDLEEQGDKLFFIDYRDNPLYFLSED